MHFFLVNNRYGYYTKIGDLLFIDGIIGIIAVD